MQKYLHISKKSSTFVAEFNSEFYNNLKLIRVMEKVCIFKCEGANRGFVHVYACEPAVGEPYFEVMRNRHRVKGISRWALPYEAVNCAVKLSMLDIVNVCNTKAQ